MTLELHDIVSLRIYVTITMHNNRYVAFVPNVYILHIELGAN